MRQYSIWTDGACDPNPGPGGWAAIVCHDQDKIIDQLSGFDDPTTNNRMELTGPIAALQRLQGVHGFITVFSDSQYVVRGAMSWRLKWRKKRWKTKSGTEVKNLDLWKELDRIMEVRGSIAFKWVRGHSGVALNEMADQLAVAAMYGQTL